MTLLKPRPARIAACVLVGALVMVPLSANAAPTGAVPGDGPSAVSYRAKDEDDSGKNAEKQAEAATAAEARAEARAAEAAAKEAKRAAEAAAKEEVRVAEAAAREEEKLAEAAARQEEQSAEDDPTGAVTGLSPVGTTPPEGEVVSIDQVLLPTHLSAAMELFDQSGEASNSIPAPVATPTGMVTGNLVRGLAPVLPPMLVDVVAAPFVVLEALIDAMAASGQALVIPFLAGAAGFMAPGLRRKHLLAEALGQNPEPAPSNEPRTVFIGW